MAEPIRRWRRKGSKTQAPRNRPTSSGRPRIPQGGPRVLAVEGGRAPEAPGERPGRVVDQKNGWCHPWILDAARSSEHAGQSLLLIPVDDGHSLQSARGIISLLLAYPQSTVAPDLPATIWPGLAQLDAGPGLFSIAALSRRLLRPLRELIDPSESRSDADLHVSGCLVTGTRPDRQTASLDGLGRLWLWLWLWLLAWTERLLYCWAGWLSRLCLSKRHKNHAAAARRCVLDPWSSVPQVNYHHHHHHHHYLHLLHNPGRPAVPRPGGHASRFPPQTASPSSPSPRPKPEGLVCRFSTHTHAQSTNSWEPFALPRRPSRPPSDLSKPLKTLEPLLAAPALVKQKQPLPAAPSARTTSSSPRAGDTNAFAFASCSSRDSPSLGASPWIQRRLHIRTRLRFQTVFHPVAQQPALCLRLRCPIQTQMFQMSHPSAPPSYSYSAPYPSPHGVLSALSDRRRSSTPSYLTPSSGASEGLSPSLSSINTGSSQGSQAPAGMQYTYGGVGGHTHGGWPTPGNPAYTVSSGPQTQQQPLGQQHYGRPPMYNQQPGMQQFNHPRSSQSPATGDEGLPNPPYGQVHHPFQTSIPGGGGGGGQGNPSGMSSAPQPPQSGILSSQHPVSTQSQGPPSQPAHVDPYANTRPSVTPSYYTTSTPQQSNFSPYAAQHSPSQHSPSSNGPIPRSLGSLSGPPQAPTMAPPAPYRPYAPYQQLPTMGGSVMSNIHQPGGQMSMIPGMGVPQYGHHPGMMYGHGQPAPQSERPFKCDQCIQSFSRNHDLKRHKRIHLAVKPFPCLFCSKSFSRKDALKRHRLVKGCESKADDHNGDSVKDESNNGSDGNSVDRNGDGDTSPDVKKEM
ncbi:hypothetical protein G7046_g5235 [Stylonectria norvegica]|nr:hypothetical protein G7046_g5235 [Stylonectria norvegica]